MLVPQWAEALDPMSGAHERHESPDMRDVDIVDAVFYTLFAVAWIVVRFDQIRHAKASFLVPFVAIVLLYGLGIWRRLK